MPQKSKARVFQAIRMYVNDELGELRAGLDSALELLGRARAVLRRSGAYPASTENLPPFHPNTN